VQKLQKLKPGGGAALYDSIYMGLHQPQVGGGRAD